MHGYVRWCWRRVWMGLARTAVSWCASARSGGTRGWRHRRSDARRSTSHRDAAGDVAHEARANVVRLLDEGPDLLPSQVEMIQAAVDRVAVVRVVGGARGRIRGSSSRFVPCWLEARLRTLSGKATVRSGICWSRASEVFCGTETACHECWGYATGYHHSRSHEKFTNCTPFVKSCFGGVPWLRLRRRTHCGVGCVLTRRRAFGSCRSGIGRAGRGSGVGCFARLTNRLFGRAGTCPVGGDVCGAGGGGLDVADIGSGTKWRRGGGLGGGRGSRPSGPYNLFSG